MVDVQRQVHGVRFVDGDELHAVTAANTLDLRVPIDGHR
jgi:hypothetical protein